MFPSEDQIRDAAYERWQRRGGGHGRDRDDWLRAEQGLLYALNYRVVARAGSAPSAGAAGNGEARTTGRPRPLVCRFCEQAAPRVSFSRATISHGHGHGHGNVNGPWFDAGGTLCVPDECDDCRELFDASFEDDLARLLVATRDGWTRGGPAAIEPCVPIPAFKGLTRMALACLPRAELESFEGAIEWVGNPDHEFDAPAFGPLTCLVQVFESDFAAPWAAVSLRSDREAPMPHALFHLGHGHALFQVVVPFCEHDDDHDGQRCLVPLAPLSHLDHRDDDPIGVATLVMTSSHADRTSPPN